MAASEGYAIKLRQERAKLALAEAALKRIEAGNITRFDRIRWKTLKRVKEFIAFKKGVIEIMESY